MFAGAVKDGKVQFNLAQFLENIVLSDLVHSSGKHIFSSSRPVFGFMVLSYILFI